MSYVWEMKMEMFSTDKRDTEKCFRLRKKERERGRRWETEKDRVKKANQPKKRNEMKWNKQAEYNWKRTKKK